MMTTSAATSQTVAAACGRLPRLFTAKNGQSIELRRLPFEDGPRLLEMYLAYQPRNSFQGLPPLSDEVCAHWVRNMLNDGVHIVACVPHEIERTPLAPQVVENIPHAQREECEQDDARDAEHKGDASPIVGHVALFPINEKKCELLVVVSPAFQNLGIGTELVRSCIELAGEMGFQRVWLPVDATNVRARHVYRKCGFEYASGTLGRELDMVCDLDGRIVLIDAAHAAAPPRFHFPAVGSP